MTNINIVVTGTTNGDTGFFDPGAGFSNRISAAISGAALRSTASLTAIPHALSWNVSVAGGAVAGRGGNHHKPGWSGGHERDGILTVIANTNTAPVLQPIP